MSRQCPKHEINLQCRKWVAFGLSAPPSCDSTPEGTADEIWAKTDFGAQMSVAGGGPVVPTA